MSVDIVTVMLIDTRKYKKLFGDKKPDAGVMVIIVNKCRNIVNEALWSMFLEDPDSSLSCRTFIEESKDKMIKLSIKLSEDYYNKHFGRLIEEEREKELNKLITRITDKLNEIAWKEIV